MKKKLYICTLEKIDKRYTTQWYLYWKKEFSKYFNVGYIDGTIRSDKIKSGQFLDIAKTNIWKAEQIKKVSELFNKGKIKDNDIFIFADGWHYGITAIKYMSQLNNIKTKLYGYFHAGTWDEWDFISQAGLGGWAFYNEAGWFNALDGSFVATNFHKELISKYFGKNINSSKIHVVGFPMDWEKEIKSLIGKKKWDRPRKKLIVFPHRVSPEKSPELFDKLAKIFPEAKFVKTMEVTKNKYEYYKLMSNALGMFSANKQETFGIGTVEALMMDVMPIVPDRLSYNELYDDRFKYNLFNEAVIIIRDLLTFGIDKKLKSVMDKNKKKIIKQSLNSINKMSKIMGR